MNCNPSCIKIITWQKLHYYCNYNNEDDNMYFIPIKKYYAKLPKVIFVDVYVFTITIDI